MSNQHHTYSHPGPSYYPPPPGPHYHYGHGAPYYPYPMSHIPNGHSPPPPPHQPASPRMNGSVRGGYNSHRAGAPNYQQFPHMPHHHSPYLQHQPMSPATMTPTTSYPHPQKYSPHVPHIPYSPSYNPPPNGGYNPAWTAPPPTLSPLPKQLSIPAQFQPPMLPSEGPVSAMPIQQIPFEVPTEGAKPQLEAIAFHTSHAIEPLAPSSSPPPPGERPEPPPSEPVDRPLTPTSPASTSSRLSQSTAPPSSFVVWSRKPRDPSRAQGVMISARAHPPQDMLDQALDIRTPPQSPKVSPAKPAGSVPSLSVEHILKEADAADISTEILEIPSSSTTETTAASTAPVTPMAGSPSTTNTSVLAASPVQRTKSLGDTVHHIEPAAQDTVVAVVETSAVAILPQKAVAVAEATPQVGENIASTSTAPPPPKPAATGIKKSWASLLQSADSQPSSSKSRLPTSSVVGFSIPAGFQNGSLPQSAAGTSSGSSVRPEVLNLLTTGPTGASPPPRIRPRGLVNTGNMCFANAVLQALVYCPPFYRLFTELGKHLPGPVVGQQQEGTQATPIVDAIIQFLKEFGVKEGKKDTKSKGKEREEDFDDLDSFIPTYVYEAMKEKKRFASMVTGHQEDAEEFLGFFLDTLEEELLSISSSMAPKSVERDSEPSVTDNGWLEVGKKNRSITTRSTKNAESPITRIFGGQFRSTLKAPHQRDSVTVEDWRSLRLDIQREQVRTINDALQYISHPHSVEITSPTRPGQVIEASRQELVEALPPVLVLHLKRFLYDTTVGDVVKIGKQVTFTPELEIGSDLVTPTKRLTHPVKYQLFGALYHHGQSASGGHYTLDVLHPNRDLSERPRQAWIRIDDELVSDVRPEDVFGGQERDDRCAYLLFYRRLGAGLPNKPWSQAAK